MSEREKDEWSLRTVAWVLIGLAAGVLVTVAVQRLSARTDRNCSAAVTAEQAAPAAAVPAPAAAPIPAVAPTSAAAAAPGGAVASTVPAQEQAAVPAPVAGMVAPATTNMIPTGVYYSDTTSGYPIAVGGRAIDPIVPAAAAPLYVDPGSGATVQYCQPIGRNGLLSNGSVDPPSTHGRAYSR